jgi:hypothetical protein
VYCILNELRNVAIGKVYRDSAVVSQAKKGNKGVIEQG